MKIKCSNCGGQGDTYYAVIYPDPYEEWGPCEDCEGSGFEKVSFIQWIKIKYWRLRYIWHYKEEIFNPEDLPF